MIVGEVGLEGVPTISLALSGDEYLAIIDTGFNGDLELPESLKDLVNARYLSRVR